MTKDDIIELAFQAGIRIAAISDTVDPRNVYMHELERFANLVAAAQRKFDADMVDSNAMACENPIWRSLLQANADAIRNGKVDEDDEL